MSRQPAILAMIVIVTIGVTSLFGQTTELAGDTLMRALIDEIRTLRLSLQKNAAYEIRGRLLIDRARLQQETIRELSREIEAQGDYFRNAEDPARDMDYMTETTMAATAMPMSAEDQRRMQEQQKEAMERRKAMEARHREQMRVRYQRMESRLQEERDKLRAIEDELAEMQRELTK
jgi:hypothetical protein